MICIKIWCRIWVYSHESYSRKVEGNFTKRGWWKNIFTKDKWMSIFLTDSSLINVLCCFILIFSCFLFESLGTLFSLFDRFLVIPTQGSSSSVTYVHNISSCDFKTKMIPSMNSSWSHLRFQRPFNEKTSFPFVPFHQIPTSKNIVPGILWPCIGKASIIISIYHIQSCETSHQNEPLSCFYSSYCCFCCF